MHLLLKNYRLSDDVAFRFSNRSWASYPLRAETYCDWLGGNDGHTVNLFMDYETFGEQGPELFLPGVSGTIIPNGGIGGTVINVNFSGNTFMGDRDVARKIGNWQVVMQTWTSSIRANSYRMKHKLTLVVVLDQGVFQALQVVQ
jgi:hypothetical protein